MKKKSNSRTVNTIYNFITSVGGQFITILVQFIVRTVFIQTLGKSFLGINGLFSNVLSMLSLAELGVGSAILFKLYDPLSKKDEKRIKLLMKFYKKVYLYIGIVIFIMGVCLIPFLRFIVKDYDKISALGINAVLVYMLYLMQSVSSYIFFAYKSAIVRADQKEYILNLVTYVVNIVTAIVQIIILKISKNFNLYVIIMVLSVIIQNYINSKIAEKMYPCIKEHEDDSISKNEIRDIFKDCAAIFIYKINGVVLKATDNIVISVFMGLEMVGIYSNYYVLYTTINTVFSKIFDSVTHSLGNLHTIKNDNHEYTIFKTINLIAIILGVTFGIEILCVSDEFVEMWIGEQWKISQPFSLLMGIEVFTLAFRLYMTKYRNTMGLFQQAKYRPLFGMIINIISSVILVKYWGICGVLAGTIIADWTTLMWFDPWIIHKYGFKNKFSVKNFYFKNIFYIVVACIVGGIDYTICSKFFLNYGWMTVFIHAGICGISAPLVYFVVSKNKDEMKKIYDIKDKMLRKIKK